MADWELHIVIEAAKVDEAVAGFCEHMPNITRDPHQWDKDPLTDAEWMKYWCIDRLKKLINTGMKQVDQRAVAPRAYDDKVVEEKKGVIARVLGR